MQLAAAEADGTERRQSAEPRAPHEVAVAHAQELAATLTATAFGLSDFGFIAPSDCGLGLFARSALRPGQFIAEYSGPRLPLELAGTRAQARGAAARGAKPRK